MKRTIRPLIAGAAAVAIIGATLAAGAGAANAATTPPWEPDPNSQGSLVLYDSAGNVLTGGTNLNHIADYAAATSAKQAGATKASLVFAAPDHTKPDSTAWYTGSASASTNFPSSTAPAPLTGTSSTGFQFPVVTLGATDGNIASFIGGATSDTTAGYAGIYQLRLYDSGPGVSTGQFWAADISVNTSAGTWSLVYPSITTTTTTLTANPPGPFTGTPPTVTLTATIAPASNGTLQFYDGTTPIGSSQAVTSGTGTYTTTTTPPAVTNGTDHAYKAVFTPTAGTLVQGSQGTVTVHVGPPLIIPTVTLARASTSGTTAFTTQTFTGQVSAAAGSPALTGTLSLFADGSTTPLAGTLTGPDSSGNFSFTTTALNGGTSPVGDHSVVASYIGTGSFGTGTSAAVTFHLGAQTCPGDPTAYPAGQSCSDTQSIQVAVSAGYITITTPYTATNPFVLPAMQLAADGSLLTTSAQFPAASGPDLTITSTLAGDPNWTATLNASDLTGPAAGPAGTNNVIDGQNVGLTGWATDAKSNSATVVSYTDNAALAGVQPGTGTGTGGAKGVHTFATTTGGGNGTLQAHGVLTINAPTNTINGTYNGTIVFTVG